MWMGRDRANMWWMILWQFILILSAILSGDIGGATKVELDGPQLRQFPHSLTHFSNSVGLTLSCLAQGPPPLIISWLGETGEELPQIPGIREQLQNGSLHFSPFPPEHFIPTVHAAAYRCSVRNPVGTFLSPVFRVRAILDDPFNVAIKTNGEWVEGSPALLECEVSPDYYAPFVRAVGWKEINQFGQEREIQIESESNYQMSCDGSLLILAASVQQLFVCIAQNRLNRRLVASPPFLLKSRRNPPGNGGHMGPKSILSKQVSCRSSDGGGGWEDDSQAMNGKGSRADLLCLGVGNPTPTFRWERHVPTLSIGGGGTSKVIQLGSTGPLLQLGASAPNNETYLCEAHNAFGSYSLNYSISGTGDDRSGALIPNVTVEPQRILAKNGQTVEFTCRMGKDNDGVGGVAYSSLAASTNIKWFKDGKPLALAEGGGGGTRFRVAAQKLFIFNTRIGDQGMYQCFSKDDGGTGGGTLLFPSSAPELVQSFITQSLQPGPSLSLKCSAVGNPAPQISWEVDGLNLSESSGSSPDFKGFHHSQHSRYSIGGDGGGGGTQREAGMTVSHLNISEVRVEDSGEFKCRASNLVDSVSHHARLNVYGPIFVKEMGALTLVHGESARIPCHYGGFPVDKVVWEKDSQPIIGMEKWSGGSTTPTRFSLFPNGTLQIGRISTDTDKGRYTCRVSNRKGEVAAGMVHVNVMRPPVISQFKFDTDLKEGQRTSATCNVISGDPPIVIGWWKDGLPIPRKLNVTENRVRFISFLIFDELREEHNGEYACSASNAAAVVRLSAKLEVRVPPKWTKVPENSKVILKSDHLLSCSAKGVPSPTISWFREINGIKSQLRTSHKYAVGQDGTLKILSVEERDSATYICEAANGIGSSISQSIRLDVIIPAKITAAQSSIVVAEGTPASLQCQIRGDRPVEVVWKKNSTVIPVQPPTPSQLAYQSGSGRKVFQKVIELNESVLSAQLEIEQSEMNDSAVYVCLASNQYGRDEDRINLQVKARPTPPENFIVEEIGSRFIRLRWSKPQPKSNVPITQFILEWRNSPSFSLPSWKDSLSSATSGQAFNMSVLFPQTQAVIEGLIPVTNYQVRLFAWNDIGGSLPTEPLTVLTLAEAPSGPPRNVSGVPLSSKSLLVKWEPPEPDFQHGAILGYQVTAQLQAYSISSSGNNGTVVVDQKWDQQSEVKGLRPNSPYRISVLAYNSAGAGPESPPFFIQTPEGAPDSPPLNLQCEALSPKSLQVQWEMPPAHLSNGQILGYKVIYIPAQLGNGMGSRLGEKPEVKKTSNRETTLHGLRSYTSYAVRILAYTAGGESETSKPVECITEEDVPEEPADIKVLMTSPTSVLVSWLPPHSPNGAITKYTIFWKSDETGVVKEKQYVPLTIPSSQDHQPSFEIRKLKEGQKYSFWITASTNAGLGKPSRTEVVQLSSSLVTKIGARIASFPVNRNVLKDKAIRLPCKAVGSPTPKLYWFKSGQPIHSNGLLRNGSLFLSRIKNEDEGEYICRAENELGSDELHHGIIISRPPSAIQIFVGYVTDTSIQIHWEPPEKADPPLTGYLLEYRRSHEVLHEWQSMRLDNLLTSYSLEGLLCGAHYELRLAAENAVGRGEFSDVAKARTNGNAPESSPRLTEILDGNWTMVRADLNRWPDGGCPLTSFQIEFRREGDQEWRRIYRRDNATRVFNIQTQPEGKYHIKIWVANDAGSVMKTFLVEAHADFFLNYAKVLERVEEEEKLNGGSSYIPFYTDPHVLVPIVSAVICTAAITVCVLMLIKRKKQSKPGGWKYNSGSNQQSWLSSDQQGKSGCGGDGGSSKYGTEECMSIYATLNSTKPIPMTIRDSTVRLQSFGQHDNYDAPPNLLSRRDSGSRDKLKKSRRKSKSLSSPLEEVCMEQVSCDMEFSNKIEPPREFRSSTSIASQQQHHNLQHYGRSPHQSQPNHIMSSTHTFGHGSSEEDDGDHDHGHGNAADNEDENGRRLSRFSAGDDEMLYHDYSCPYQFGGEHAAGKPNRQGTLTKKRNAEARNKSRKYFE